MLALRAFRRSSHRTIARRSSPAQRALILFALLMLAGLAALASPSAALALAPGDLLWLDTFSAAGSGDDRGTAVAVGDGGIAYVAGTLGASLGSSADIVLVARTADGAPLWETTYDGPAGGADAATSLAVSPAGALYVAGYATRAGSRDLVLLKFDSAGNLLWRRFCGGSAGSDRASALTLDRSGNVLVAGWVVAAGRGADTALAKYTPAGKRLWLRTRDGAAHRADKAFDLAVDRAGNALVAGSTSLAHTSQTAALLLRYSASGELRWVRRQSMGTHGDAFSSVALGLNGTVFAGGRTHRAGTGVDALVVKYTVAGAFVWKWIATAKQPGRAEVADVAVDSGGWVHAVGSTTLAGTYTDGLVMSSGPNGLSRSIVAYDGGDFRADAFRTVTCDAANGVYVGGFTTSGTGATSAVVAKYARDLSQRLWLTAYKGTAEAGGNRTVGLALAPGSVLAAGTVVNAGTGPDLALAKLQR